MTLVPPPVLTTTLVTVSFACGTLNVLVIVHALTSLAASVIEPLAAQSPEITAV